MTDERVDAFITREGEIVSLADADRTMALAEEHLSERRQLLGLLFSFARHCQQRGLHQAAERYLVRCRDLAETKDQLAFLLLTLGQVSEAREEYRSAARWYRRGLKIDSGVPEVRYFLRNNLGYCLNALGSHHRAGRLCVEAIAIDPGRHNAHKNLGIALEGLGRYAEAAHSYTMAARLCPHDRRAHELLEKLKKTRPLIALTMPA